MKMKTRHWNYIKNHFNDTLTYTSLHTLCHIWITQSLCHASSNHSIDTVD